MDSTPITLRPIEEADLGAIHRFDTDPSASEPFEWRGFISPQVRRRRWEDDGLLGHHNGYVAVALPDGTMAGFVNWRAAGSPPAETGCLEIGILLMPEHRGKGFGTAAQKLLADYLFNTTLVHRIQATTEVDNVAEQRALERAGFRREGRMRGASFVRGLWVDGYLYARLRDDPV